MKISMIRQIWGNVYFFCSKQMHSTQRSRRQNSAIIVTELNWQWVTTAIEHDEWDGDLSVPNRIVPKGPLASQSRICSCILLHIFSLNLKPTKPQPTTNIYPSVPVFFFNTFYVVFFFLKKFNDHLIFLDVLVHIVHALAHIYAVWQSLLRNRALSS